MTLFLWVIGFEYIACNLAHPMTPAIIKTLHLGDYMFGLAFAAMAITNFLFSPFWGTTLYPLAKIPEKARAVKIIASFLANMKRHWPAP